MALQIQRLPISEDEVLSDFRATRTRGSRRRSPSAETAGVSWNGREGQNDDAGAEQRLHAVRTNLPPNHDRSIIVHQVGNRLIDRSIDHHRLIDVGQHRFHLTPQVRIIGTRLADERQSLGWLQEDGGLEHGDHALTLVDHDARISRSLSKRSARKTRKKDKGILDSAAAIP